MGVAWARGREGLEPHELCVRRRWSGMSQKRQARMSVLARGVGEPCVCALVFSWEPQLYQYNRSRLPDRTREHWRQLDHWNGSGHCGGGAHPGGDRAAWRSVFETDLYAEGTRILRAVQEQVRTVCGAVYGKRGGDES